jgi:hypothetical protein
MITRTPNSPRWIRLAWTLAISSVAATAARADVGPPVEIKMPRDSAQAAAGEEYTGIFEVRVYQAGTLADFKIEGQGWTILKIETPGDPIHVDVGVVSISFRAVPSDANQPIGLTLTYNGRRVSQRYEIGPTYFGKANKGHRAGRLSETGAAEVVDVSVGREIDDCGCGQFGIPLIGVKGRIAYTRPDGRVVGVDRIRVQLRDEDPVGYDLMWEGFTDVNGDFDTGCVDADVDGDGSRPDLVLYFETDNGWVDVTDNSILESTYSWATAELTDFPFACHDYGTLTTGTASLRPALHIFNVVTRARRYLQQLGGFAPSSVQVEWPVDEWTHYQAGPEEIHMNPQHEWMDDVVIHEYGHHFMYHHGNPPGTNYCNDICDNNPPEDCGHCGWCPENESDAFNEGFPNWMAGVIVRAFADTYAFDNGDSYVPPASWIGDITTLYMCEDPEEWGDPLETENFVAALLRDMEDDTQDDHDGDGIFDLMCVGAQPIFNTYVQDQATTVLQFINHFRNRYPAETGNFWATAFNVGGPAYVAGFPTDSQAPGIVPGMDSSSIPPRTTRPVAIRTATS